MEKVDKVPESRDVNKYIFILTQMEATGTTASASLGTYHTTSNGAPVGDNQNSMTAGARGPILLQDFTLVDKLAAFDR